MSVPLSPVQPRTPCLCVEKVTTAKEGRRILEDISFELGQGECLVVCGPSGCGKTSLLRAIAALDPVLKGRISLLGEVRNAPACRNLGRGKVGMVFQGEQLYRHLTLLENITVAPRRVLGLSRARAESEARALLDSVGLLSRAGQYPSQLSGGESQRGAILRALAMHPALMLFDEPTSGLDPDCVQEVLALVRSVSNNEQSMIVVTHQMAFARSIADRLLIMNQGRILSIEQPESILLHPGNTGSRALFRDALPDISALDRVSMSRSITVGIAPCDRNREAELGQLPLLTILARKYTLRFRIVEKVEGLMMLRIGLADLLLVPDDLPTNPDLACWPCGKWRVAAAGNDFLWKQHLDQLFAESSC